MSRPFLSGAPVRPCLAQTESVGGSAAFEREKLALGITAGAAGEAAERAACPDDPVARDDEGDRIGTAGAADGAGRAVKRAGEVTVAPGFAIGNDLHRRPHPAAEGRPLGREGQREFAAVAGEIFGELARGLRQHAGIWAGSAAATEVDRRDRTVLGGDRERADGTLDGAAGGCHGSQPSPGAPAASSSAPWSACGSVTGSEQTGPTQT